MAITVKIPKTCPVCQHVFKVTVPLEGYEQWHEGNLLIQDAMPELTADAREQLITGICEDCWDKLFTKEDDSVSA